MGFLAPKMPRRFDVQLWHLNPRMERIAPLVKHWAEHGFGQPWVNHLFYLVKAAAYLLGGLWFIQSTPGIGPVSEIATWWTEPVVFQKAVIWTLLFEVAGLGCGSGPMTVRFVPPFGGLLYWLRPGTVRLPPWNGKVLMTRGTRRNLVDVLLYAGMLAAAVWPLLSPATYLDSGLWGPVSTVDPVRFIPLVVLVPLIGLRDKTIFLAARAEHCWLAVVILLLPFLDMVVIAKLLLVLLWWSAATSKLHRLFPFAVAVMLSNSPLLPKAVKRRLYRDAPEDMRPSGLAATLANTGTVVEFLAPLVLLVSTNQTVTLVAAAVMVCFHLHILISVPVGVPMEWNLFMVFSLVWLFVGQFAHTLTTITHPWLIAALALPVLALVAWGNVRPDQVSFLLAMRYYTGNWTTTMWALKPSALAKIDANVAKYCGFAKSQLRQVYGEHTAEVLAHKVYAFRALHHHGRGLFGLLPRAAGPDHEEMFVLEGELVAGAVLGWNFGEGRLHDEQLLAALQERCHFEPGEVRLVVLEARAVGSDRQEYRLVDAATGEFERGYLLVSDLTERQPWETEDLPIYPVSGPAAQAAPGRLRRTSRVDAA